MFRGRSRRREYCYFALFSVIINVVLSSIDGVSGTFDSSTGVGLSSGIFGLAILVISGEVTMFVLWFLANGGAAQSASYGALFAVVVYSISLVLIPGRRGGRGREGRPGRGGSTRGDEG